MQTPELVAVFEPRPRAGVSSPHQKHDYLPALTGLRFWLAAWVMLHHISGRGMMLEAWTNSLSPALATLVQGGYLAVQTFFVLSGFVLAKTYARTQWSIREGGKYAAARFARIYPVYVLSLAVVAPFIIRAMLKPTRTAAEKTSLLFDYVFVLQGWKGNLGVGWNTPAGSLSCEFVFYLCFPLLIIGLRKAGKGLVGLTLAASLVVPVLLAHSNVPWDWKPIHHFSDFAAGVAAARLFDFLRPAMDRRGYWLYLPAILAGMYLIVDPAIMYRTYGDLNTGLRPLNAIAIVGFALSGGLLARFLSAPASEYLGKISYSMYILHVPILWWYGDWSMHGRPHMPAGIAALSYFVLVTAVAALAFEFVEMPANRWIRGRVNRWLARGREIELRAAA
ncbi:MAG: acyltransferase [Acidobacteriota bacterium]|nr:acyltransferase [Acidobacteriota bacterium]